MAKKEYFLVGIVIVILVVGAIFYWNYQKTIVPSETPETPEVSPIDVSSLESETDTELDSLSNDLKDMEEINNDTSLDNLDASLSTLAE